MYGVKDRFHSQEARLAFGMAPAAINMLMVMVLLHSASSPHVLVEEQTDLFSVYLLTQGTLLNVLHVVKLSDTGGFDYTPLLLEIQYTLYSLLVNIHI